jgi:GNAT superfamily N-acetyltransferase
MVCFITECVNPLTPSIMGYRAGYPQHLGNTGVVGTPFAAFMFKQAQNRLTGWRKALKVADAKEARMTPFQPKEPYDWEALLALIRRAFAGMEGRIDPPSSLHKVTPQDLATYAGEVWVIGQPPRACMVLTPKPHALNLGRLSVDPAYRRKGYAHMLITHAEARARALGLPALELQSRIELVENHAIFFALGFKQVGATTHPGFAAPTSLVFTKQV